MFKKLYMYALFFIIISGCNTNRTDVPAIINQSSKYTNNLTDAFYNTSELGTYVPSWGLRLDYNGEYIHYDTFDFTNLDWVVSFGTSIRPESGTPYLNVLNGHVTYSDPDSIDFMYNYTGINQQAGLIQYAHAVGTKVLLGISCVDPTDLKTLIALGEDKIDTLAKYTVRYCNGKGYDGVDINIETWITSPPTPTQISMVLRKFRYWMNYYAGRCSVLTIAPVFGDSWAYQSDSVNMYCDAIHIQMYAFEPTWYGTVGSNVTWYLNPLRKGTGWPPYPIFNGSGIEDVMPSWLSAGFQKSKIQIGISTYGWCHPGVDTLLAPVGWDGGGYSSYQEIRASLNHGGVEYWDINSRAMRITGIATSQFVAGGRTLTTGQKFYFSTPHDSTTYYVHKFVSDNGYGGMWFYDASKDHDELSNPKNPIINYAQVLQKTPPVVSLYDDVRINSNFSVRKENTDTTVYPAVQVIKPTALTPVNNYDPVTIMGTMFYFRRGCVDTTIYPPVRIQK